MFYYRALIRDAPALEAPDGAIDEFTVTAVRAVLRRQLEVPTQAALRYPHAEALLESLRGDIADLPPELVPRACDTLLTPQVVVPTQEPEQFQDGVRRRATLLSLGEDSSNVPRAVVIAIELDMSGTGKFAPVTHLDASVAVLSGESEICDALEDLYLRATPPARADGVAAGDRAMWLGGDRDDGTLPPEGIDTIAAVLAVRGFSAEVVQRPLRTWPSVKERLDNQPPDALLVWTPYATPAPYGEISRGRFEVLTLDEGEFTDALLLARFSLDELRGRPSEETLPSTWEEVEERLGDIECASFVVTDNARVALRETGYPHPGRMWEHLQALADAAAAFAAANGSVGDRLADWIHETFGIEVAMHDDNLGEGQTRIDFDGGTYSREPHVKVDDAKAWIEVGRIYFAVDADGLRFIVDYIGGKLY